MSDKNIPRDSLNRVNYNKVDTDILTYTQLPGETDINYNYFVVYRSLPARARTARECAMALKRDGHDISATHLNSLSARYRWRDRASLWDNANENNALAIQDAFQNEYIQRIIDDLTQTTIVADELLHKKLAQLRDSLDAGEEVRASEIKTMVDTLRTLDDLKRRSVGLPTSYKVAETDEPDYDKLVYGFSEQAGDSDAEDAEFEEVDDGH